VVISMLKKQLFKDEKGVALPMVLMVLTVFSVLGMMIVGYVDKETKTQKEEEYFLKNRYLAESAAEDALYQMKVGWQGLNFDSSNGFYSYPFRTYTDFYTYAMPSQPTSWTTVDGYGSYYWKYDILPSSITYHWKNNTLLDASGLPRDNTIWPITTGTIPDQISYDVTLYGTGKVNRTDHQENAKNASGHYKNVRTIKVTATVTVFPYQTPNSPVIINVKSWTDANNYTGSMP
jgi:hypothetical protein